MRSPQDPARTTRRPRAWRWLLLAGCLTGVLGLGTSPAFGAAASTDVLFVFDTTGSMSGGLAAAQLEAQAAMETVGSTFPNVRFGAAQMKDFGSTPVWQVTQGLTSDKALVANAIDTYSARGGGDDPEAYGTALRQADRDPAVGWLPGARRIVVFIADDVPHDEDLNDGVPLSIINQPSPWGTGSDAGLDGNAVDWQSQLAQAAARGLTLAYVHYNGDPDYLPYWNHWAGTTGGSAVAGGDGTSFAATLSQIISSAAKGGLPDQDRDGLPDLWEVGPVDLTGDGAPDLDLPALGARPDRPDIFLQLDWTPGALPNTNALRKVVQAFERHGVSLHIDRGPGSLLNYTTREKWGARSQAGELAVSQIGGSRGATEPDMTRLRAFGRQRLGARAEAFRYALSDTAWWGRTGSAFTPGQAFYVSVCPDSAFARAARACDASDDQQAGTIMHELGHTLGLGHGGSSRSEGGEEVRDDTQWKPNYLSVMNYYFQYGTPRGIDYSDFGADAISLLDERSLSERDGILTSSSALRGLTTQYACRGESAENHAKRAKALREVTIGTGSIDWNCNGKIDSGRISASISTTEQPQGLLIPRSDWSFGFTYRVGTIGASAYGALDESTAYVSPEPSAAVLADALESRVPRPRVQIRSVRVLKSGRTRGLAVTTRIQPVGTRGVAQVFLLDKSGKRPAGASKPVTFRVKKRGATTRVVLGKVGPGKSYRLLVSVRTDAWSVRVGPVTVKVPR